MITFHFLNVGQGNMAVGIFPDDTVMVYDCNITNDNQDDVFAYLKKIMPANKTSIDLFVNSHRDADHLRGIKKLHEKYPIGCIWDSGVSGNTDTTEYTEYMAVRRSITNHEVTPGSHWKSKPNVKILNGKRNGLDDVNSQSIVLHIDYEGSSLMLAGDTSASTWREHIIPEIGSAANTLVLYASHHGSYTFFNEDEKNNDDYTKHLEIMNPAIAIISVSDTNPHGHPHPSSLKHYENHCYGTVETKQKIFRTDRHGHMKLELKGQGEGTIYRNQ